MVEKEIIEVVKRFVNALKEDDIAIEKVILYGSMVTGRANKYSDIDIAIISPNFGKDRFQEGLKLRHIASNIDPRIESVPVSLRTYEKETWIPLIYEIRTKGVEL